MKCVVSLFLYFHDTKFLVVGSHKVQIYVPVLFIKKKVENLYVNNRKLCSENYKCDTYT